MFFTTHPCLYWSRSGENEEGIYLAYEKFEGHLTTIYLLDEHLDLAQADTAFKTGGALSSIIAENQGI
jgi:hypothetical protein